MTSAPSVGQFSTSASRRGHGLAFRCPSVHAGVLLRWARKECGNHAAVRGVTKARLMVINRLSRHRFTQTNTDSGGNRQEQSVSICVHLWPKAPPRQPSKAGLLAARGAAGQPQTIQLSSREAETGRQGGQGFARGNAGGAQTLHFGRQASTRLCAGSLL